MRCKGWRKRGTFELQDVGTEECKCKRGYKGVQKWVQGHGGARVGTGHNRAHRGCRGLQEKGTGGCKRRQEMCVGEYMGLNREE